MENLFYKSFVGRNVIVRSDQAGVYVGQMVNCTHHGGSTSTVHLKDVKWIWEWEGAASTAQIAAFGIKGTAKIPTHIPEAFIEDVNSIFPITDTAYKSISEIKVWVS